MVLKNPQIFNHTKNAPPEKRLKTMPLQNCFYCCCSFVALVRAQSHCFTQHLAYLMSLLCFFKAEKDGLPDPHDPLAKTVHLPLLRLQILLPWSLHSLIARKEDHTPSIHLNRKHWLQKEQQSIAPRLWSKGMQRRCNPWIFFPRTSLFSTIHKNFASRKCCAIRYMYVWTWMKLGKGFKLFLHYMKLLRVHASSAEIAKSASSCSYWELGFWYNMEGLL